ncbi:MAG: response regulator [Gemmatimonadetes bacterium]|nr:MAG: response regulator [Gemmatimonadota bacterium]
MSERPRILCVDDEIHVLESLKLTLRKDFDVRASTSAAKALEMLESMGPFAVVVSDMRMPEMSGAEFLAQVRERAPDSVRVLLTGQADLPSSIAAVNEGQIYRFLTKPCAAPRLREVLRDAVEQYRLIVSERVLLDQTLKGSIEALFQVLAIASPPAFGRGHRIKAYAARMAQVLPPRQRTYVQLAAMFSQIGFITLPPETAEKLYNGAPLDLEEQAMVRKLPGTAQRLIRRIPRLEPVVALLDQLDASPPFEPTTVESPAPGLQVLRVARDFEMLEERGHTPTEAMRILERSDAGYDGGLLSGFAGELGIPSGADAVTTIPTAEVRVGMVLAEDLRTSHGILLASRGMEISDHLLERIENLLRTRQLRPTLKVLADDTATTHDAEGVGEHEQARALRG